MAKLPAMQNQYVEFAKNDSEGRNIADTLTELENKPSGTKLYKHAIASSTQGYRAVVISSESNPYGYFGVQQGSTAPIVLNSFIAIKGLFYFAGTYYLIQKIAVVSGAENVYNLYYSDTEYFSISNRITSDTVTPL